MGLKLPPMNSPIRDLFDVSHLAMAAMPGAARRSLPTLPEAKRSAMATMAAANGAIRGITAIVLRGNDDVTLWTFGPKGGARQVWNFSR